MNKQRGVTLISFLIILAVALTVGGFLFRVLPCYGEYSKVVKAMKVVGSGEGAITQDLYTLRQAFRGQIERGGVESVTAKDLRVSRRAGGGRELRIKYEVPIKLLSQLGVVARFERVVEITPAGQ